MSGEKIWISKDRFDGILHRYKKISTGENRDEFLRLYRMLAKAEGLCLPSPFSEGDKILSRLTRLAQMSIDGRILGDLRTIDDIDYLEWATEDAKRSLEMMREKINMLEETGDIQEPANPLRDPPFPTQLLVSAVAAFLIILSFVFFFLQ